MFRCDFRAYDTLVFREAKELTTGGTARSVLPMPSTFYGALRTHYLLSKGIPFEAFHAGANAAASPELKQKVAAAVDLIGTAETDGKLRALGPLLSLHDNLYFPAPLAPFEKGAPATGLPADREPSPLWDVTLKHAVELPKREAKGAGYWLAENDLKFFLVQGLRRHFADVSAAPISAAAKKTASKILDREGGFYYRPTDDFFCAELRHGHEREPDTLVVKEHMLYSLSHLRPTDGDCARLTVFVDDGAAADFPAGDIFLGGRRRISRMTMTAAQPDFAAVNEALREFLPPAKRFFLYLATPAIFAAGWRPRDLDLGSLLPGFNAELVSAATGKPVFAGMRNAAVNKPRPGREAVPAGSVYFYQLKAKSGSPEPKPDDFRALVDHYQFNRSLSDQRPNAGFGITCIGIW